MKVYYREIIPLVPFNYVNGVKREVIEARTEYCCPHMRKALGSNTGESPVAVDFDDLAQVVIKAEPYDRDGAINYFDPILLCPWCGEVVSYTKVGTFKEISKPIMVEYNNIVLEEVK